MEESHPIGSTTYLVNISRPIEDLFTSSDRAKLAEGCYESFRSRLKKRNLYELIIPTEMRWENGCVVVTISIALSATAVAGGIYKFIKDYEDLRSGMKSLLQDLGVNTLYSKKDSGNPDEKGLQLTDFKEFKSVMEKHRRFTKTERYIFEKINEDGQVLRHTYEQISEGGRRKRITRHPIVHMRSEVRHDIREIVDRS